MRILVIEDHAEIAAAVKTMLERQRFAADGDRGLDALLDARYDAAVIDVVLPGADGLRICRMAREHGVMTPVLVLSARDSVEDRVRGLDAGADDYLVKPFVEAELGARVRALLRRGDQSRSRRLARSDPHSRVGRRFRRPKQHRRCLCERYSEEAPCRRRAKHHCHRVGVGYKLIG